MRRIVAQRFVAAAAVVAAAVFAAPPAAADAGVLTPGAPIAAYAPSGAQALTAGCTAGWLARDSAGAPVMLTAGHCAHLGDAVVWKRGDGDYVDLGRSTHAVDIDLSTDIGVMALTEGVPFDARVLGVRRVAAAVKHVTPGETVCLVGRVSGRKCGTVSTVTAPDGLVANVRTQTGDSGGPVYWIDPAGVAYPVGIIRGGSDEGRVVVQRIDGVLRDQQLTLMPGMPSQASVVPIGHR